LIDFYFVLGQKHVRAKRKNKKESKMNRGIVGLKGDTPFKT